ncbi:MAG: DUF4954 domain-containing protein [Odoribacter sp.]|nr:DUF4954 domain-containing protein [Odoribacter sp.]
MLKPQNMLNQSQISALIQQGCNSSDWSNVILAEQCEPDRFRNVIFIGNVSVGNNNGTIQSDGIDLPCGIYNAIISNCTIGNGVRIANIGSVVANCIIGDEVLIENVASLVGETNSSCGNGVELDVVNEGGGRGTMLINQMTSQTAYLQALVRHNAAFTKNLSALIERQAKVNCSGMSIGENARIIHCGAIKNVNIGPFATIHGSQNLENGTILSCPKHPTEVGEAVLAKSFIISEGAKIDSGAILDKVFIGQAVKLGKQFSAENSMFFANCEGFHGEAVSLFAGPYTVTHHKSTLLIAGLFSFFNAGSGSNQSNHMYKLGPVHQGVFERGCKTGSFSYVLLESHIGAFSVVIGKHFTNINAPNLPFSYIHEEDGASKVIPGMNLFSVGTVRDGEKWPKRDNRKSLIKKDLIIFDVFSPYTVEKMLLGRNELLALSDSTPKEKAYVNYGGLQINRLLLRKGAKYYALAITRYLNDKVCSRISELLEQENNWEKATASFKPQSQLQRASEWTDISGLLVPREKLVELEEKVVSGSIASFDELLTELQSFYVGYKKYEWQYIYETFSKEYHILLESITKEQAIKSIDEWQKAANSLHSMVFEDSKREFGNFAKIGYGIDKSEEETDHEFASVRGSAETNGVVQKISKELIEIQERCQQFTNLVITIK